MDIVFTEDQKAALSALEEFCTSSKISFLLSGSAGTGKTTLMKYFVEKVQLRIIGLAPTHKAKGVLRTRLPPHVPVMTLAKFLYKLPKHTYIGTKSFDAGSDICEHEFDMIILDEVSMVSDSDFKLLKGAVMKVRGKILAIGDECQIPAVSQRLEEVDGVLVKKPCAIFNLPEKFHLSQIVRQASFSPIIGAASFLRDNMDKDVELVKQFPELVLERALVYASYLKYDPLTAKIIAYTNKAVEMHNRNVRTALGKVRPFDKGEILMGYQTIGYPTPFIENSSNYVIERVKEETNGLRQHLRGWTLTLKKEEEKSSPVCVFFPELDAPQNKAKLEQLVSLARKVNAHKSSKLDFRRYRSLKDQMLFVQNIYEYDLEVLMAESIFKARHPLLFSPISDLVDEGYKVVDSKLVASIRDLYGDIIENRLRDNKQLGEQETLASQFCIFEKDLDYGYSCTAHKAQGGTLRAVFVDELDFEKLKNRQHRSGLVESKTREKNQLKYVAITRASESLYILR